MTIVKYHRGFDLPVSLNMDEFEARRLYAALMLASSVKNVPESTLDLIKQVTTQISEALDGDF